MPKKRTGAKGIAKRKPSGIRVLSRGQIQAQLQRQKESKRNRDALARAQAAKGSFRARKKDRGHLVMVGVHGQRDPQAKGRKGYLVYVTRTGKKWLIKEKGLKGGIQARKITDIEPPARKNLSRAIKEFQSSRREMVSAHRAVLKGKGSARGRGVNDFSDTVVRKMAGSIRKALSGQKSHRSFLISANVLVRLPDGSERVYAVQVPIARPDHIAIKLGGILNFVRKKFYAFMAKELAYDGYVSSGSANHIRRLKENYGVGKTRWENADGTPWRGQQSEVVRILVIEWKIEQIK